MNKINIEIRDQFDFFKELLDEQKTVLTNPIHLVSKKSNIKWLSGRSSLQHNTINEDLILIIDRSKRDNKYGLKLRCISLTSEPFFRFDSDGPAHRNDDPSIPLEDQLITTPHFNSFQSNGKAIAYKNKVLLIKSESKAIVSDLNFGVSLFCVESNCSLSDGNFPLAIDKTPEIEFSIQENFNFDNINFE